MTTHNMLPPLEEIELRMRAIIVEIDMARLRTNWSEEQEDCIRAEACGVLIACQRARNK